MLCPYRPHAAVVLVHGPWFDACIWHSVILPLRREGLDVMAVQLPLTSLESDVEALRMALTRMAGPVLLVGHSYAGAVVSVCASREVNVVGTVYISALAPVAGESSQELLRKVMSQPSMYEAAPDKNGFIWATEEGYGASLAPRGMPHQWLILAATQHPIAQRCLEGRVPAGELGVKPSWFLISEQDEVVDPQTQRSIAVRIAARIVSRDIDHASPLTEPEAVLDVIFDAASETLTRGD